MNYFAVCDATEGAEGIEARRVAQAIREIIAGRQDEFVVDYPCHGPDRERWFYLRAVKLNCLGPAVAILSHEDITPVKSAEERLRRKEAELLEQKRHLEEMNVALNVLLRRRDQDRVEIESRILTNVKELVLPYVQKLKRGRTGARERARMEVLEVNIGQIVAPFVHRIAASNVFFTPQEIRVATLIKGGRAARRSPSFPGVSPSAVHFDRRNLRKKFCISRSGANLRTHLLALGAQHDEGPDAPG